MPASLFASMIPWRQTFSCASPGAVASAATQKPSAARPIQRVMKVSARFRAANLGSGPPPHNVVFAAIHAGAKLNNGPADQGSRTSRAGQRVADLTRSNLIPAGIVSAHDPPPRTDADNKH